VKAGVVLVGLTVLNLAWQMQPDPGEIIEPVGAATGTAVAAELLPGVGRSCSLVVFFEPGCPFCGQLADAQRTRGLPDLEVIWVTDDPMGPGRLAQRLPGEAKVLVSRDLFRHLSVRGVPSAGWIRDGVLVATGMLTGEETRAELVAPCDGGEAIPAD
jgi:hypothetical protein